MASKECCHCGKRNEYEYVEYREYETGRTHQTTLLLQFCTQDCLQVWLAAQIRDGEKR